MVRAGSIWLTGANAYDDYVKSALGVAGDEQIVGFIYLGTPTIDRNYKLEVEGVMRTMDGERLVVVAGFSRVAATDGAAPDYGKLPKVAINAKPTEKDAPKDALSNSFSESA